MGVIGCGVERRVGYTLGIMGIVGIVLGRVGQKRE